MQMGHAAAKQGDRIVAQDVHIVMVPSPPGPPTPTPLPHPFSGVIGGELSPNVRIMGRPAALSGSSATNTPPHVPTSPGAGFQRPPANRAIIQLGSSTVRINGRPAARNGDKALTCNDPTDLPAGTVIAQGTVFIG
jgi:uncharacterized Zn-binding protein involved in type VI secretion